MGYPTRDSEPLGNLAFNLSPLQFGKRLTPRSSSECGGEGLEGDEYNLGLHIMALFVLLAQSSIACAFPLIVKRFPGLRIPPCVLFFARHFGTGVLLSTAFVHLLPTAFISLTNPCLSAFWNQRYPAMAGAIALAAVFFVTTVEMVFACGLCKGSEYHPSPEATAESGFATPATSETSEKQHDVANAEEQEDRTNEQVGNSTDLDRIGFGIASLRRSRSHPLGVGLQKLTTSIATPSFPFPSPLGPPSPPQPTPHQLRQKALLQVFLLELGILFHSIFIGMSLSVTTGPSFIVLLIAIIFHQTFEGLALGSRIAALEWSDDRALQPWLMACAYGLTTPAGQAIGLGTHTLYSPESEVGLLVVGIMNAISSGLLLFAGLVELLAEDFLSDDSRRTLRGARRVWASAWVFLGAFGMALVGAWA